ncbi:MAG: cobalt-precorrin-6A reductase [Mesorhizobium sp.]|nr:cobalt-precorrin-6A reductase [Mesorhizobium sp.]MBL8575954.1 cobalt-precorrin-6A reductase [Mesorhizobium sp.]
MKNILILGGTADARQLAGKLAGRFDVTLSLAGRTENPVAQGVPVRVGGFGGAEGLAAYLRDNRVDLLIDATHPYAAHISANAAKAAAVANVPAIALRRPAWERQPGDRWTSVESASEAVGLLGARPRRVFLALGRQELLPFEAASQHAYLIRSVDPVEPPLAVPDATYILARGPFSEAGDRALLETHGIDAIVSKNSGGQATYGKIAAARALGVEVFIIRRPPLPDLPSGADVDETVRLADHALAP